MEITEGRSERLIAVTEPSGNVTSYSYDLLDNAITVDLAGQPAIPAAAGAIRFVSLTARYRG